MTCLENHTSADRCGYGPKLIRPELVRHGSGDGAVSGNSNAQACKTQNRQKTYHIPNVTVTGCANPLVDVKDKKLQPNADAQQSMKATAANTEVMIE